MLNEADIDLFKDIENLAWKLAKEFDLPLRVIEPKRRPNGALGLCYHDEGRISILLRHKEFMYDGGRWDSDPRPLQGIQRTVCHELAHLIYPDHGAKFKQLEQKILTGLYDIRNQDVF